MDTAQNENADMDLRYIDSFYKTLQYPGEDVIYFIDSIKESKYGFVKHDYIQAIAYLDTMQVLIQTDTSKTGYAERLSRIFFLKGEYNLYLKKYYESQKFILLAETVSQQIKDNCKKAEYSGFKGYLLRAQEKYVESASWFLKQYNDYSCSCDTTIYDKFFRAQILSTVAASYLRAGMLDSASKYCNTALDIINLTKIDSSSLLIKSKLNKSTIYAAQAEIQMLKGNLEEAEIFYTKSIQEIGTSDEEYKQSLQSKLVDTYLKENKTRQAGNLLISLKASMDSFNREGQVIIWHKLMSAYYTQLQKPDSAFAYLYKSSVLKDAAFIKDKKFHDIDFNTEFETVELNYTNSLLQKENQLKKLYLIIVAITLFAIAAIITYVWISLKYSRRLYRLLDFRNEDMQKALTSLEKSHQENSRILRIVAHDLRNPITAINTFVYTLLRKKHPQDVHAMFLLMQNACTDSLGLIRDILQVRKTTPSFKKELVNIRRLLEYCIDLLQSKADEKNQHLTLRSEDILLPLDRQRIWRVISNIVNNAMKFSPEQSVIDIKLQRKEASAIISVHDVGIGIPEEMQGKIFETSLDTIRHDTGNEPSYGMGLSISRQIIEEHNGKIWFESSIGKGSVFYIELPYFN